MKKQITQVICEDIQGNEYQVPVSDLTFRPAVYGVIVKDGQILLSKQWDGYDFPGGGIELGESISGALVREVKEETGLKVKVGKVLHCENSFFKLPFKGNFVHSIHLYYRCEIISGELSTKYLDEQEKQYAGKPEWVALEDLANLKIYSSVNAQDILQKLERE
jgi:8-oxo-dGTP diphosphatase